MLVLLGGVVLLLAWDWLWFGSFGFAVLVAPSSLCDFECLVCWVGGIALGICCDVVVFGV